MSHKTVISVGAGAWDRFDKPVEVVLKDFGGPAVRIVEIDESGKVLDANVPYQFEQKAGEGIALTWMMSGVTPAGVIRRFRIVPGQHPAAIPPRIIITDGVMYQNQESYQITTPNATYFYHKWGAGFASVIDADGSDWLSYRPCGGSDGKYRGIPNLVHPENYFHPGGTGCISRITCAGPLKATIHSESRDGKWACDWDIFPAYARLTVLKVAHPYWFLYEGTPGGALDEAGDYCVRSNRIRLPLTESWAESIPAPEWIYFGASNTPCVLYLVHHEAAEHIDSFWPMEHNMTVFGFGRNGLEKHLTQTPAQFTIGFARRGDFEVAQCVINSAFRPLRIAIGENLLDDD